MSCQRCLQKSVTQNATQDNGIAQCTITFQNVYCFDLSGRKTLRAIPFEIRRGDGMENFTDTLTLLLFFFFLPTLLIYFFPSDPLHIFWGQPPPPPHIFFSIPPPQDPKWNSPYSTCSSKAQFFEAVRNVHHVCS